MLLHSRIKGIDHGYSKPKKNGNTGIREPEFYIFPISYIKEVRDPDNEWGKIVKNRLVDFVKFKNQWSLIATFLESPES